MKCGKCHAELPENSKFCPGCGERIVAAAEAQQFWHAPGDIPEESGREKKRFNKRIGVIALLVCVVCGTLLTALVLHERHRLKAIQTVLDEFMLCVEQEDYAGAAECAEKLDESVVEDAQNVVHETAREIYKELNSGNVSSETALKKFCGLKEVMDLEQLDELEEELNALCESKKIFSDAEQLEQKGEKAQAVHCYLKVIRKDSLYKEAQKRADRLTAEQKEQLLNEAENLIQSGDYAGAVTLLEESAFAGDAEILSAISDYKKAHRQTFVDQANTYIAAGQYESAISCLNDCITVCGDDEEITKMKDTCLGDYRASFLSQAAALAEQKDYAQAVTCLQNGMGYFGEDSDFAAKIKEYEQHYANVTVADLMYHLQLLQSAYSEIYGIEWRESYLPVYASEEAYKTGADPIEMVMANTVDQSSNNYIPGTSMLRHTNGVIPSVIMSAHKAANYNSMQEWEVHMKSYFADEIVDGWKNGKMSTLKNCCGGLYLVFGARGYGGLELELETARIISCENGNCSVLVNGRRFTTGAEGTVRVDFQFRKGRWILVRYENNIDA